MNEEKVRMLLGYLEILRLFSESKSVHYDVEQKVNDSQQRVIKMLGKELGI